MSNRNNFRKLLDECRKARISLILVALIHLGYRLLKKNILAGSNVMGSVWIESNVSVHRGAMIPVGCLVALGAVVGARFTEKKTLIAGSPAKIIRKNIAWK